MAFSNAQKFTALGMAFPLAKEVGDAIGTIDPAAIAAITSLTDSTTGTPSNTLAAIPSATAASTDTSAASLASTNATIAVLRNEVASLGAKVNAIIAALQ